MEVQEVARSECSSAAQCSTGLGTEGEVEWWGACSSWGHHASTCPKRNDPEREAGGRAALGAQRGRRGAKTDRVRCHNFDGSSLGVLSWPAWSPVDPAKNYHVGFIQPLRAANQFPRIKVIG